jgi:hypothetical protein
MHCGYNTSTVIQAHSHLPDAEETMVQIVVTAEQAKRLEETREPIEIIDENGHRVGFYTQPFSKAEILEAKRRSEIEKGGRTTKEVLDRLSKMDAQ